MREANDGSLQSIVSAHPLLRMASEAFSVPMAVCLGLAGDAERMLASVGLPDDYDHAGKRATPSATVFEGRETCTINDVTEHPALQHAPWVRDLGVRALAGVPLTNPSGERVGALWVMDVRPRTWSDADIQRLTGMAEVAAIMATLSHRIEDCTAELAERDRVLDGMGEGLVVLDRNWHLLYINATVERHAGCRRGDVLGRNVWKEFRGFAGTEFEEKLRSVVDSGERMRFEALHRPTGRWLSVDARPMGDTLVVSYTDVTERRETREALKRSEAKFRGIVETANEGIWLVDSWRNTLYVNPILANMLGETVESMRGTTAYDFMFPEDLEEARLYVQRRQAGLADRYEWRFRRRDGSTLWASVSTTPVYRDDGTVEGALSMLTDITENHRYREQLEVASARFRAFLDNNPSMGFIKDEEGRYVYVSEAFEHFYGIRFSDIEGKTDAEWQPAELAQAYRANDFAVLASGRRMEFSEDAVSSEGARHNFISLKFPVPAPGGKRYLGGMAVDITDRKAVEKQLEEQAFYDTLTGLPNRALLNDRLEQALRLSAYSSRPVAVLFLDLDRFKVVNDSLGHPLGDRLLMAVAQRLKSCVRDSDTVARFGGDEFVVLLPEVAREDEPADVAEGILKRLSEPFTLNGRDVYAGASIGIVIAKGGDASDAVLRDADVAMYQAKAAGGGRSVVFHTNMAASALDRLEMESSLRCAVERREFELHYQPIVSLSTGGVVAVEALVRWRHPRLGLLYPDDFLEIQEQLGLMDAYTRWLLAEVARERYVLLREGLPVPVSVNLSARSLHDRCFAGTLAGIVRDGTGAPSWLVLEITESSVMHDPQRAMDTLSLLNEMGVATVVDDFGTGYSSLAYLNRLPVRHVKIDKEFLQGMARGDDHALAIVRATIGLAHDLHKTVVAEGVESAETLDALRRMGCDMVQGFHVCRPLPMDELVRWLATYTNGQMNPKSV